jgi:glutamate synthase domain-containing protein 2
MGRGRSQALVVTSPGIKVVEEISKTRMIPKGTDALSPAL